jgi:uncharacterized protein YndB with AHSA1/START domain
MSDKNKSATAAATRSTTVIERTYRASVEELWDLWTTKEGFESWWGPEGCRVNVHAIEACANGKLHYDMIAETAETIEGMKQLGLPSSRENRATFSEFKPYERLVLTHVMDFLLGLKPFEVTILVEFFRLSDMVRMVTTIYPTPDDGFTRMSVEGFTSQLTKLDRRFPTHFRST